MKAKLHYQKILEWTKTAIEQLPKELQEKIKALDLNYQLQDKDNSEHRIKIVSSGDKEVSSDILEFLQAENPAKQIISFEESLKIITLWEKEGVTSEEPEESLNILNKDSTKEMLELCMYVAKNYFTLKNGFYKSPTKKFVICKMDLAADNINTPARIGNSTKIVELSDKLQGWTYSEILYMLVWCFCKVDGVVVYEKSDIKPINILKDVESFNLIEAFQKTAKILPYSENNTKRLECMFGELKELKLNELKTIKSNSENYQDLMKKYNEKANNFIGQEWDIVHGFKITNHDNVPRKAIIGVFGYSNKVNYGSESGIEIKSNDGKEFGQFLKEIAAADDFKVEAIDIHCKNEDQLNSVLTKRVAEVVGVKGEIKHIMPDIEGDNAWYECNYTHSNVESLEIVVQPNTTLTLNIINNIRDMNHEEEAENTLDELNEKACGDSSIVTEDLKVTDKRYKNIKDSCDKYVFSFGNLTNDTKRVSLFNHKHSQVDNIEFSSDYVNFLEILKKWKVDIELIKVKSLNATQVTQIITICEYKDDRWTELPIISQSYILPNQTDSSYVEIPYNLELNDNIKLDYNILPKTKGEIIVYFKKEPKKEDLGADIGNHHKSDVVDVFEKDDVNTESKGDNSELSVPIPDRLLKTPKNILENYLLGTILKSNKISKTPYHLKIKNKTEKTLTSNIFGFNEFFNKENENWGNPEGISLEKGVFDSYNDVLLQSAFKPFKTALIVLKSNNKDQVTQIITVSSVTGKGQTVTIPLITKSYYKDIPTSIPVNEINYELNINYQTKLQMPILPKTEVDVYVYHYKNDKTSLIKELDKLKYKVEKLENKKWWHFFFSPKK